MFWDLNWKKNGCGLCFPKVDLSVIDCNNTIKESAIFAHPVDYLMDYCGWEQKTSKFPWLSCLNLFGNTDLGLTGTQWLGASGGYKDRGSWWGVTYVVQWTNDSSVVNNCSSETGTDAQAVGWVSFPTR